MSGLFSGNRLISDCRTMQSGVEKIQRH